MSEKNRKSAAAVTNSSCCKGSSGNSEEIEVSNGAKGGSDTVPVATDTGSNGGTVSGTGNKFPESSNRQDNSGNKTMHRSYSDVMLPRGTRKEWRQRFSFRQKSLKTDQVRCCLFCIFFKHLDVTCVSRMSCSFLHLAK